MRSNVPLPGHTRRLVKNFSIYLFEVVIIVKNFTEKHYIVVIEKVRKWECWSCVFLPIVVIRRLSNCVMICFGYHTDLGDVNCPDLYKKSEAVGSPFELYTQ